MISYKKNTAGEVIDLQHLEKLVTEHKPSWLSRAKERTDAYRTAGEVTHRSHIWSEIKEVFMKLQGNKCAFCERQLEGVSVGKGEHDVEHFRPKNSIREWDPSQEFDSLNIAITSPPAGGQGYHLLTYNLQNYSISCGPCNQALKADKFPIKGTYKKTMENPMAESAAEVPLLLFPIGDVDVDCESLISFEGSVPQAVEQFGLGFERAMTTIDFFRLNAADQRGILFLERSEKIVYITGLLLGEDPADYDEILKNVISDLSKHANCARSYVKLMKSDPDKAREIFKEAKKYVRSYIPDRQINE